MTDNTQNDQKQIDQKTGRQHQHKTVPVIPQQNHEGHPLHDPNDDPDEKHRLTPDHIGPGQPAGE